MPFDGTTYKPLVRRDLVGAITLLERGLARVTEGYCWAALYRPKTRWRSHPQFCMEGALYLNDNGGMEHFLDIDHQFAEQFLRQVIKGRSLVDYGTIPFARWRVIRAYKKALATARSG